MAFTYMACTYVFYASPYKRFYIRSGAQPYLSTTLHTSLRKPLITVVYTKLHTMLYVPPYAVIPMNSTRCGTFYDTLYDSMYDLAKESMNHFMRTGLVLMAEDCPRQQYFWISPERSPAELRQSPGRQPAVTAELRLRHSASDSPPHPISSQSPLSRRHSLSALLRHSSPL